MGGVSGQQSVEIASNLLGEILALKTLVHDIPSIFQ